MKRMTLIGFVILATWCVADGLFSAIAWRYGLIQETNVLMLWTLEHGLFGLAKFLQLVAVAVLFWCYLRRPIRAIQVGVWLVVGVYTMVYVRMFVV